MVDFRSLQIEHFAEQVGYQHQRIYGSGEKTLLQDTLNLSRMALSKMAVSNSLFFNVNHTKRAGMMALQLLDGVLHQRGSVDPALFLNLVVSTLFSHVGLVGGILQEDEVRPNQPKEMYYIGDGEFQTFFGPSSNSVLWPFYINRSLLYIERNLSSVEYLNTENIISAVKNSDVSLKSSTANRQEISYHARSAHVLSYTTQSQYNQWLVRLYRSLEEANLLDRYGFSDLGEFRKNYGAYFWKNLYSDLAYSIPLFKETGEGRDLLATLFSRMN